MPQSEYDISSSDLWKKPYFLPKQRHFSSARKRAVPRSPTRLSNRPPTDRPFLRLSGQWPFLWQKRLFYQIPWRRSERTLRSVRFPHSPAHNRSYRLFYFLQRLRQLHALCRRCPRSILSLRNFASLSIYPYFAVVYLYSAAGDQLNSLRQYLPLRFFHNSLL